MTARARRTAHDLPHILRTVTTLRDVTGLPLTFGGAVDAQRQVQLSEFAGPIEGPIRGVTLRCRHGLGGQVVARRRPMIVNDYLHASAISHDYDRIITAEGLRAMVAAPIVVQGTVRGVLYAADRTTAPLGERVVDSVLEAARDLEQNLLVRDETSRRMDWLDDHAKEPSAAPTTPHWEQVREAYAHLRVLAKDITDASIRERFDAVCEKLSMAGTSRVQPARPKLSHREIDVLSCVALGWTNSEIANELDLQAETVKSYLRSAMRKLASSSRLEAVVTARRHGLLP